MNYATMNHARKYPELQIPTDPIAAGQPKRILVVEDNKDTALALMTLLAMKGYEVHSAYDGNTAVAEAASFDPDIVFLDIDLPDISGHEVARRIRAKKGGEDIRLIALTAWQNDDIRRRSAEVGCSHHLVKPVRLADLMYVIRD